MYLSEDHRAVQDAVRAFVRDRIAPQAAAWDRDSQFPREELKAWPSSAATASRCRSSGTARGWTTCRCR